MTRILTGVLGHGDDLGQQLGEVGQVVTEEAGLDDEGFAGVRGGQLSAQQFGFTGDAQSRATVGVLVVEHQIS